MDKQLIERMKAEVRAEMRSMFSPSVESFIDAYADRLIERIDAERGKSAAAVVEGVDGYTGFIKPLRKLNAGTTLFTSPAILECTVMFPPIPTEAIRSVLETMLTDCHSIDESYADLVAAAQGERS